MANDTMQSVRDPRLSIARSPMSPRQIIAIAMCVALNALDGFDVLSISFASPGIAREWGIDRAALGIVLSMELIGMIAGSVALGQVADRVGRRATVIASLVIMAVGMLGTTQVHSIAALAASRLFTGLGIGGMLATTNALVAEYANDRWRAAAVAIMAAGYPLGAIAGGSIVSTLLAHGDWRQVFYLGATMTAIFLPFVPWLVPESVASLLQRRPVDALQQVNKALNAMGHAVITVLPPSVESDGKGFGALFKPGMARLTLLLTAAYFTHVMTFYFILKWVPKIVVDMGFKASSAGGILVWANVGGLIGGLTFSVLAMILPPRRLLIAAMFASVVMVSAFGQCPPNLRDLGWAAALGGFCTNAGMVGLYAVVAGAFPTGMRAGGTGFVIGVGRGGAALGPIVAGFMFQGGFSLGAVAALMACGSLVGALALLALPDRRVPTLAAA